MPNIPYQYLTAGQKARLSGGNRRRRSPWNGRRWTSNRRGSSGFSGFKPTRRRYNRGGFSYYR